MFFWLLPALSIQLCWRAAARAGSSFCGTKRKGKEEEGLSFGQNILPSIMTHSGTIGLLYTVMPQEDVMFLGYSTTVVLQCFFCGVESWPNRFFDGCSLSFLAQRPLSHSTCRQMFTLFFIESAIGARDVSFVCCMRCIFCDLQFFCEVCHQSSMPA